MPLLEVKIREPADVPHASPLLSVFVDLAELSHPTQIAANTAFMHEKERTFNPCTLSMPYHRPKWIHEEKMRPTGRILAYMPSISRNLW